MSEIIEYRAAALQLKITRRTTEATRNNFFASTYMVTRQYWVILYNVLKTITTHVAVPISNNISLYSSQY